MLPGAGCEFRKQSGGCTMCGFGNSTDKYTHGHLLPNFVFKTLLSLAAKKAQLLHPNELYVYNGGSFWNDHEIPRKFQEYLYCQVASSPSLKHLFIENRCEYIGRDKIVKAVEALDGKRLTVGIGLESQDNFVRNTLIKKGLSKISFAEKVDLLRKHGAKASAYIFLKPLGLNEEQALQETLQTIRYALSTGVSEINLSCAFIQDKTPMADAYRKGEFLPPKLWTILEIIKEIIKNNWPVSIGGFDDEPPPLAIPQNCPECSPAIYKAIESFRQTRILGEIPECGCRPKV
jgi:hypothetical protein